MGNLVCGARACVGDWTGADLRSWIIWVTFDVSEAHDQYPEAELRHVASAHVSTKFSV